MFFIPRKFVAFAYLCVIVVGVLLVLLGSSTKKILRTAPSIEIAPTKDLEMEKVEQAIAGLKADEVDELHRLRKEDVVSAAMFPEGSKDLASIEEKKSVASVDPSLLAIVITQSPKGRSIYLDGAKIKRGDVLQGGITVRESGPTYFVLEDSAGARRRIDVTERLSVDSKERRTEVKK